MFREKLIAAIKGQSEFDVLVIGGGINGIGTFRELALQKIRVLLVERNDFASGASAASSHMVHGGIRYLENGEFRLVREAVNERNLLLQNAPHLVRPLPTVIPVFKIVSGLLNAPMKFLGILDRPAERGAAVIKAGLMLYDAYTRGQNKVPNHRFEGRHEALKRFPKLNPKIKYAATYYDAAMRSPERLALEVLLDGMQSSSDACAANYVSVMPGNSFGQDSDNNIRLKDEISGDEFSVRAKLIVNAAGPWIDLANNRMGHDSDFIGGTKGSHLVIRNTELREAIGDAEFFFENSDGRITLIFPHDECVLIGTSDIPIEDPDDARCSSEEIEYFLEMLQIVFPGIAVERRHIVYRYSGVRPLPAAVATRTGQISRDHSIRIIESSISGQPSILSLVGGKWTTFRAFAAKVTSEVLHRLNRERLCDTQNLAIGGGRGYPVNMSDVEAFLDRMEAETKLDRSVVRTLFERYGTRAADFALFLAAEQAVSGVSPATCAGSDYFVDEFRFMIRNEYVQRIGDLLQRRTSLAMQGKLTMELIVDVSKLLAVELDWDDARCQSEIEHFLSTLQNKHGVMIG